MKAWISNFIFPCFSSSVNISVNNFQDNYYAHIHVEESKLPAYFFPPGKYKLQLILSSHGKKIADTFIGFDLIMYSSEKQKLNL